MGYFRILSLLIFMLIATVFAAGQNTSGVYIEKYKGLAIDLMLKTNVPASVILGVALVESGAGNSALSRKFNNHFGITGKNTKALEKLGYRTRYKEYESDTASFRHFCDLMASKPFYPTLVDKQDYKLWVPAIRRTGYAGSAHIWEKKVKTTIIKNKLYELDRISMDPLVK
jgi:Bax protein